MSRNRTISLASEVVLERIGPRCLHNHKCAPSPAGRGLRRGGRVYRQALTPHPNCCAIRPLPRGEVSRTRRLHLESDPSAYSLRNLSAGMVTVISRGFGLTKLASAKITP